MSEKRLSTDDADPRQRSDDEPADDSQRQSAVEDVLSGDAPTAAADHVEDDVRRLGDDLAAAQDRLLRAQADLDNFRKRATRERESERRYAVMPLLKDLLPAIDNIHRAIEAAENAAGTEADAVGLLSGVKLLAQQIEDVFARHHCTVIDALGTPFDPNYHEAISQVPSAEHPPGTVVTVAGTGYLLHDRVVRAAQVIVSAPPAAAESNEG